MDKEALKKIVTFELESSCPDSADIGRCSEEIAEKLGDDFAPRYFRVCSVVLACLQVLEACLVEAEIEQLAGEIAEKLCEGAESEDEEDEFFIEIEDEEEG